MCIITSKRDSVDNNNYNILKKNKRDFKKLKNVTFNYIDGGKKVIKFNDVLFNQKKNKPLNEIDIIMMLNSIKHNYKALNYIIN